MSKIFVVTTNTQTFKKIMINLLTLTIPVTKKKKSIWNLQISFCIVKSQTNCLHQHSSSTRKEVNINQMTTDVIKYTVYLLLPSVSHFFHVGSPTVTFLGIKNWFHARWPWIKESVSNHYSLVESNIQGKMESVPSQYSDHFSVTDNTKKKPQ